MPSEGERAVAEETTTVGLDERDRLAESPPIDEQLPAM